MCASVDLLHVSNIQSMHTIFIYYNLVSGLCQRSVHLYKNRKETAVYKGRNSTQNNTETQNTQNGKQIYKQNEHKMNIKNILTLLIYVPVNTISQSDMFRLKNSSSG